MALISNALHIADYQPVSAQQPAQTTSPTPVTPNSATPNSEEAPSSSTPEVITVLFQWCQKSGISAESFQCDFCTLWTHNKCPKAHEYRRHKFCRTNCRRSFQSIVRSELCYDEGDPLNREVPNAEVAPQASTSKDPVVSEKARKTLSKVPEYAGRELVRYHA